MSKKAINQRFHDALHGLWRNYPDGVTTWGQCCTEGCENSSRGSGKCADCYEEEIAEVLKNGDKDRHSEAYVLANDIHDSIAKQAKLKLAALEFIADGE